MGKRLEIPQLCENLCGQGVKCTFDGKDRWQSNFPERGPARKEKGSIEDSHKKLRKEGVITGELTVTRVEREGRVYDLWVKKTQ